MADEKPETMALTRSEQDTLLREVWAHRSADFRILAHSAVQLFVVRDNLWTVLVHNGVVGLLAFGKNLLDSRIVVLSAITCAVEFDEPLSKITSYQVRFRSL